MTESKSHNQPHWRSLDELVEYFDTHDMGDHFGEMPEVDAEVSLTRKRYLVEIEEEILERVAQIARGRQLSSEELINLWLKEKVLETAR